MPESPLDRLVRVMIRYGKGIRLGNDPDPFCIQAVGFETEGLHHHKAHQDGNPENEDGGLNFTSFSN